MRVMKLLLAFAAGIAVGVGAERFMVTDACLDAGGAMVDGYCEKDRADG